MASLLCYGRRVAEELVPDEQLLEEDPLLGILLQVAHEAAILWICECPWRSIRRWRVFRLWGKIVAGAGAQLG
jgi:hypothetical protein